MATSATAARIVAVIGEQMPEPTPPPAASPAPRTAANADRPRGLLGRFVSYALRAAAKPVQAASQDVVAGAKAAGRSALDITIFVIIGLVGYVFVLLGAGLLLAPVLSFPLAMLLLGAPHLVVGVLGVIVLVRRKRSAAPPVVDENAAAPTPRSDVTEPAAPAMAAL